MGKFDLLKQEIQKFKTFEARVDTLEEILERLQQQPKARLEQIDPKVAELVEQLKSAT